MYKICQFSRPSAHPFGMMDGIIADANEKEFILMEMLIACIDAGQWIAVSFHSSFLSHCLILARMAYITVEPDGSYRLTDKALGLLIKYYPARTGVQIAS